MTDGDDHLELLGSDKAILVGVEVFERLTKSFALQALHELRELVVIEDMATVPLAQVQFHPVAVMIVMVCGQKWMETREVNRPSAHQSKLKGILSGPTFSE